MSRLLEAARQALSRGESGLAVELLESAHTMDDERVTPRLVSTLLASAKAAMQTSVPEAIELYRRAHRLDPGALKPRSGLMLALIKRSHESMGSGDLAESHRVLSEALDVAQSQPKYPLEEIVSVRLVAALRVLGERCLQDGDVDLCVGAGSLLARGVEVLGLVDGDEPSLWWLAASLALIGGEIGEGVSLLRRAAVADSESMVREQVGALADQSVLLVKSGKLEGARRVLEGVIAAVAEASGLIGDGVIDLRLVAALRVLGERCLQDGDVDLCVGAGSLLAHGVEVLGPVDRDEPSLWWLAASLALVGGNVSRARDLALKAERVDQTAYSLTEIDQSQLSSRMDRGTRVFAYSDSEKLRQRVRFSVVASPSRTVFLTLEAPTDADQSAVGIIPSSAAMSPGRLFALARDLADESIEELDRLLPEVFATPVAAVEMRSIYKFILALRLALRELPNLTSFLSATVQRKAHAVVVDPLLGDVGLRTLLEVAGLDIPMGGLDIRYSAHARGPAVDAPAGGANTKTTSAPRGSKGGALVVVGSDVELPFLRPISEILAENGPVTFLGKEDTNRAERALTELADLGEVIDARSMRTPTWAALESAETLESRLGLLQPRAQGFVRVHLAAMQGLHRTAIGFSQVVEAREPYIVAGSLERSVFGVLAMQLSGLYGFRTVNLQHGTVMPNKTSDLLRFDLSLFWNEWSRELVVKDGYPDDAPIEVVGNPRWDRLGTTKAEASGSRRAELEAWKGDDYLAVVFPQPPKGPFLDKSSIDTVYRWVEKWAAERRDVKVLAKGRPAADDPEPPETLKDAEFFRSVASEEITIEEVLAIADVAVSGYSTALLDAAVAGVPPVSADPAGVLGALPLDVLVVAEPCVTFQQFAEAMNRAITDRHPGLDGIPTEVLPKFDESYRTRLRLVLREHGLLDQSVVR